MNTIEAKKVVIVPVMMEVSHQALLDCLSDAPAVPWLIMVGAAFVSDPKGIVAIAFLASSYVGGAVGGGIGMLARSIRSRMSHGA